MDTVRDEIVAGLTMDQIANSEHSSYSPGFRPHSSGHEQLQQQREEQPDEFDGEQ